MLSPEYLPDAIKTGVLIRDIGKASIQYVNFKTKQGIEKKDNYIKLTYNILRNLEDNIISEKEIPELNQYSECNNEILTCLLKAISILSCSVMIRIQYIVII